MGYRLIAPHGPGELQILLFWDARFKAPAAAGFVHAGRADDNKVLAFEEALRVFGGVAATHADGEGFSDGLSEGEEFGHGREGAAEVIRIEARNQNLFAAIGKLLRNFNQLGTHEIRFVEANNLRPPVEQRQNFAGILDHLRGHAGVGMGDDFLGGVAVVNGWLKHLNAFARDLGPAEAANQLFTLTGKHRPANDFDPADVACHNIHSFPMMARTLEPELMDDAPIADLVENLRDLSRINRWLGGNRTLAGLLDPYMRRNPRALILDVGAANGETGRWLEARYPEARMVSLDRAERTLRLGSGLRVAADVFTWPILPASVDIVICSLFLHHFDDDGVRRILACFEEAAREAVIAVDLHRHPLARGFLPATRFAARWHPLTVHDGVISVDAAFTPGELRQLAPRARVRSHWPWFRLSLEINVSRAQ